MADSSQQGGVIQSLLEWFSLVGQAFKLRLELASLETKQFVGLCLVLIVLALLCAVCSLTAFLLVNFLILLAFWESGLFLAGGIMTALYLIAAIICYKSLRRIWRQSAPPLSATLSEFQQDLQTLQGKEQP